MKERPPSSKPQVKWLIPPRFSESGEQISSGIGYDGREYPDGVPLAPPIGYEAPTALEDLITQIVHRRDFERALAAQGAETFEEADDFDVDEDYDPRFEETIYEKYFEAKSKRAAQQEAAREEASRKAFVDSSLSVSQEPTVEKPTSVSGGSVRSSDELSLGSQGKGPQSGSAVSSK